MEKKVRKNKVRLQEIKGCKKKGALQAPLILYLILSF